MTDEDNKYLILRDSKYRNLATVTFRKENKRKHRTRYVYFNTSTASVADGRRRGPSRFTGEFSVVSPTLRTCIEW